jgi:hypothetical protein
LLRTKSEIIAPPHIGTKGWEQLCDTLQQYPRSTQKDVFCNPVQVSRASCSHQRDGSRAGWLSMDFLPQSSNSEEEVGIGFRMGIHCKQHSCVLLPCTGGEDPQRWPALLEAVGGGGLWSWNAPENRWGFPSCVKWQLDVY